VHTGRFIFAQIVDFLPERDFRRIVAKYNGDYKVSNLSCWDQFLAHAFGQLTYRESLGDLEVCLRSRQRQLYHLGFRGSMAKSTLADANASRDYKIFEEFALLLINQARMLCVGQPSGVDGVENTIYAIDSTTIELCLSIFPWARFRRQKGAVKIHTQIDLRGPLPTLVYVSDGKLHDVNWLDSIIYEAGCFYLLDRAYVDFGRLWCIEIEKAYFVTRAKSNFVFYCCHSRPAVGDGILADQIVRPTGTDAKVAYPGKLRRIVYRDPKKRRPLVFLTNNFDLPALTIALLYKGRWQIELFFKWIKTHLRIKVFYGRTPNAVKIQIWNAIAVYALLLIVKNRLDLKLNMHTILTILSLGLFDKVNIHELFTQFELTNDELYCDNQLIINF
jgi:Domain of unknown function (DUF4372)/Transposase DDE domain